MVHSPKNWENRDEDEFSLIDIICFFYLNLSFIGSITIGLAAIVTTLSLLQPKQYQKELTLSVKPVQATVSQVLPELDLSQAGTQAVQVLQNQPPAQTTVSPVYDATNQQLNVTLQSSNPDALANVAAKIQEQLETEFDETLREATQARLMSLELQIERNQQALAQLEQQSSQFSPTNEFRIGTLESYRATQISRIAELDFDKQYLEQVQENLTEFTSQVIPVEVLAESVSPQDRSPIQVVVIAVIASFMVAILAAIIREQIPRLKAELSKNKIDTSQDV